MKTVLYIDDDEDDIAIFKEVISEIDATYVMHSYSDPIIALQKMEKAIITPDIIFVDINMPRLSGKDVLSQIRQNRHLSLVPVIMYSTTIRNEYISILTDLGANDFLPKGSTVKEAIIGVSEVLKRHLGLS